MKKIISAVLLVGMLGAAGCPDVRSPDVTRYDHPLSYDQALKAKDIDFPLPSSCSNVCYAMYADWQAYTRMVRFEAPVTDCVAHIDVALKWDDRMYHRTNSYTRTRVQRVPAVSAGWLKSAKWFDPDKITDGIYVGPSGSHVPEIWVDLTKGVFYFIESD